MLLDDLSSAFESKTPHFLGSLILKQSDKVKSVIDGQQRLTTFSILVKALYDNIDDADRQEFFSIIYTRISEEGIRVNKSKIRHSKADTKDFEIVMNAKSAKEITESSKILDCYKFFSKEIAKLDSKVKFLDFIVNTDLFVVINIDEKDDEQQIFDSINSKGMPLSAADIIKNDLFANLFKLYKNEKEAEEIYYNNWRDVFEPVREDEDDDNNFWEDKNGKRKDNFFYYFALLQELFSKKEHNIKNLANVYKEYSKKSSKDDLVKFIKDIKTYAEVYQNLAWYNSKGSLKFEDYEARLMHIIEISQLETFMPIVLKLKLKNLDKQCFEALEKFIIRVWISGTHTNSLNKFVAKNISKIKDYNSLIDVLNDKNFTVDDEALTAILKAKADSLSRKIKKLTNSKATLILFWIELFNTKKELKYEYSLEHIMPQEWKKNWKLDNPEQADNLIYQIGNLTLLTKSLNSTNSNKAWVDKKKDLVKYTSLNISNDVKNANFWGKAEIEARTEDLIKDFFTIWSI